MTPVQYLWDEPDRRVIKKVPECIHHSRPVEKCVVRKTEQHYNEEDPCINALPTEENKGADNGDRHKPDTDN